MGVARVVWMLARQTRNLRLSARLFVPQLWTCGRFSGRAGADLVKRACILGLVAASVVRPAQASGLRTHIWIADQVLRDARDGCDVDIAGVSTPIPVYVCASLRSDPAAFRAGMMGPDTFPDLIAGQVTTHPGIEGDWQTADWLRVLLTRASPGPEVSFAAGFATHAAVDMFAHSYVNAYSGDLFSLGDERRVELRHFVLEKYIDYRLPGAVSADQVSPPVQFVTKNLLYNRDAARLTAKAGTAGHISAMNGVRDAVIELNKRAEDLDRLAAGTLADVIAKYLKLQEELITGEAQLRLAEGGLKVNEELLSEMKRLLDNAYAELQRAIEKAEGAESDLNIAIRTEERIRRAIGDAENAVNSLNQTIRDAEHDAIRLAERIDALPDTVSSRLCDGSWWNPFCWWEEVANPVKQRLREEATRLANRISDWKRDVNNAQARIVSETAQLAVAVNARLQKEAIELRYRGLRAGAETAYKAEKLKYDAQLKVTKEARTVVANIRKEIRRIKQEIADTGSIRDRIEAMISQLRLASLFTANWVKGIDVAGVEYVKTSTVIGRKVTMNESGAFSELLIWLNCYGGAFTPVPYQFGELGCKAVAEYQRVQARIDEIILDVLPEPFDQLYRELLSFKALARQTVKDELENAAVELVKLGAPDGATGEFIELLTDPQSATRGRLNEVFATAADSGGKALLTFPDVASLIDRDLHLKAGRLDPKRFAALRHSVTMAKIALLDGQGLRHLVWRLGSDALPDKPAGRYSILFDTTRSIDGNHQWQPYGLPYPRAGGIPPEPEGPAERHFGYGPADGKGFVLFTDSQLRREVFPLIFPTGIGGALMERPELTPPYPFVECKGNPFPVAFKPDGSPASTDLGCADGRKIEGRRARQTLRRFWRSIVDVFGGQPPANGR